MSKLAYAAVAAATVLAAPAFAQAYVSSSTGASVSSGTGVLVTPGAPSATVTVTPAATVSVVQPHILPGASMVQYSSTTVLGGPPAVGVASTQTVVTKYWANVPAGVERRADFQRWMALK